MERRRDEEGEGMKRGRKEEGRGRGRGKKGSPETEDITL